MPDAGIIAAFFSSLKTATEIAGLLRKADLSMEKADLKLQIADLVSALAEAKMQASEIQEVIKYKDEEIQQLKQALELKAHVIKQYDAYYEKSEDGQPTGDPYCMNCWETEHKLIHLFTAINLGNMCPHCKTIYARRHTSTIVSKK